MTDVVPAAVPASTAATAPRQEAPGVLRWSAIFGGTVAAIGIAMMLFALGLAFGLASIEPKDPHSLGSSSLFTGIWAIIVSLVALFVGGYVASRGASALTKTSGALHGLVVWGLTAVAGMWLVTNLVAAIASGAMGIGRAATEAVTGAAPSGTDVTKMAGQLGIDFDDVLAPVNQRLRDQAKPQVTAAQVQASARDVLQRAVRDGRLDRESFVGAISQNSALSHQDAEDVAGDVEQRFERARRGMDQRLTAAKTNALEVAEDSSKAFWGIFGALLLGMLASVGGALVGSGTHRGRPGSRHVADPELPTRRREEAYP